MTEHEDPPRKPGDLDEWTFASIDEVTAGTKIRTDDGFTCMTSGYQIVEEDSYGLFIPCKSGKHYLDGQEESGVYIGIYLASEGA